MTKEDKVMVIMKSDEILIAVKLLFAVMLDIEAEHYVKGDFEYENEIFELSFSRKIINNTTK